MRKKILFCFLIIIISLVILELFLRLVGFEAWKTNRNSHETIFEFNSKLGWISKQGNYLIPSISNTKKINKFTIEKSSNRYSGKPKQNKLKKIILIGGSFTQGAGVSDDETFAYQLQSLLPNHKILNFGQAGYGSIQSLLLLEQIIKQTNKTNIVIYGFINHHLRRNVARGEWLEILQKSTNSGFSRKPSIPYGVIDKQNNLKINPRTSYLTLPFRENSALITIVEKIYMKQTTRFRKKHQQEVLLKSLIQMNKIAKKNKSNFVFVNLDLDKSKSDKILIKMSEENKLHYVDCRTPEFEKFKLKDEYHPSKLGHRYYSKCINDFLREKKLLF